MRWYIAGILSTLIIEGAIFAGFTYGAPVPQAAEPVPAKLERQMLFKVMAPKGYEDVGYVQFNCTPNIKATVIRSGLNGRL
jgi:hypothetical protein